MRNLFEHFIVRCCVDDHNNGRISHMITRMGSTAPTKFVEHAFLTARSAHTATFVRTYYLCVRPFRLRTIVCHSNVRSSFVFSSPNVERDDFDWQPAFIEGQRLVCAKIKWKHCVDRFQIDDSIDPLMYNWSDAAAIRIRVQIDSQSTSRSIKRRFECNFATTSFAIHCIVNLIARQEIIFLNWS